MAVLCQMVLTPSDRIKYPRDVDNWLSLSLCLSVRAMSATRAWAVIVHFNGMNSPLSPLFIYLGFYIAFNTLQVISRRVVGRAEETYIQFVRALYCKLPTNSKKLPAFTLETMLGTEPRPKRWEPRVLPLCHRGPFKSFVEKETLH